MLSHSISFDCLSRFKNQFTDALATFLSMIKIFEEIDLRTIVAKTHDCPMHCNNVEVDSDCNPWYYDIKAFLKDGKYPESANATDKRTWRKLDYPFFLNREILYKKSYDGIMLDA